VIERNWLEAEGWAGLLMGFGRWLLLDEGGRVLIILDSELAGLVNKAALNL
jgi:hypothetical protein